jgi:hypothetical protein
MEMGSFASLPRSTKSITKSGNFVTGALDRGPYGGGVALPVDPHLHALDVHFDARGWVDGADCPLDCRGAAAAAHSIHFDLCHLRSHMAMKPDPATRRSWPLAITAAGRLDVEAMKGVHPSARAMMPGQPVCRAHVALRVDGGLRLVPPLKAGIA